MAPAISANTFSTARHVLENIGLVYQLCNVFRPGFPYLSGHTAIEQQPVMFGQHHAGLGVVAKHCQ